MRARSVTATRVSAGTALFEEGTSLGNRAPPPTVVAVVVVVVIQELVIALVVVDVVFVVVLRFMTIFELDVDDDDVLVNGVGDADGDGDIFKGGVVSVVSFSDTDSDSISVIVEFSVDAPVLNVADAFKESVVSFSVSGFVTVSVIISVSGSPKLLIFLVIDAGDIS